MAREIERSKGGPQRGVWSQSIDNWSAPLHCVSLSMVTLSIGYLFKRESVPGGREGKRENEKRNAQHTHTHKKNTRHLVVPHISSYLYIYFLLLCVGTIGRQLCDSSITHRQHPLCTYDNMQCVSVGIVSNRGPALVSAPSIHSGNN